MSFLPPSSTQFEIAVDEALDEYDIIAPAMKTIFGLKYARPLNPTVAPWLVYEYGLGPISGFFDTVEHQIDLGRAWQKIRGTPGAFSMAMGWIGYDNVTIYDQVTGRRLWHLYQADMGELPLPDEDKRLADAEYLASLSDPARAFFWRGFYGYDVRGLTHGRSRYGETIWGDSSGVRINGGKTQWSHGRQHNVAIAGTDAFYDAFSINISTGQQLSWDFAISWDTPGISWDEVVSGSAVRAFLIQSFDAYLCLYDAADQPIAYIKNLNAPVATNQGADVSLAYEFRTGFGDGAGLACKKVSLVFGMQTAPGVKPFKRYLLPSEVVTPSGTFRLGAVTVDLILKKTIREFFHVSLLIEE